MRSRIYLAAALLTPFLGGGAIAQSDRDELPASLNSDCHDDNMRDRCDPSIQAQTRALYGARTIEELAAEGVQVRRAFFVDGYGRDMPMVSFERARGRDPRVVVSVPRRNENGDVEAVELTAPVPSSTWNEIIEMTKHFDRALVSTQAQGDDVMTMCLHSWVVTMEASEPESARPVRRRTEDACNDGLTIDAGFNLGRRALALLPACNALRQDQHRNEIASFYACALLEGDRIAAAEALNQALALNHAERSAIGGLIHDMAQVEWAGEPSIEGVDAWEAWPRLMRNEVVDFERVVGESVNEVHAFGYISDWDHSDQPRYRSARVEQIWVRENGFDFRMKHARVGAWSDWQSH